MYFDIHQQWGIGRQNIPSSSIVPTLNKDKKICLAKLFTDKDGLDWPYYLCSIMILVFFRRVRDTKNAIP